MLIYTLPERLRHMVVNSPVIERPHDSQAQPPPNTSHGICPVCLDYYFPAG